MITFNRLCKNLVALMVLAGCAVTTSGSFQHLTLDHLDKVDLSKVNSGNAHLFFGKPDIQDFVDTGHAQEAMVYFGAQTPRTTRLSLIFDSKTRELVSAHWFLIESDSEANISKVFQRYPKAKFEKESNPILSKGLYGLPIRQYRSSNSPLVVTVDKNLDKVQTLSWALKEPGFPETRKPTSH